MSRINYYHNFGLTMAERTDKLSLNGVSAREGEGEGERERDEEKSNIT